MSSALQTIEDKLAVQIATVDALAVAARIAGHASGQAMQRFAMSASTVEIIALAQGLLRLKGATDVAYDMLSTADAMFEAQGEARRELLRATRTRIAVLGRTLEALGYGQPSPTTVPSQENNNGQG